MKPRGWVVRAGVRTAAILAVLTTSSAHATTFSWSGNVAIPDDTYNGTVASMAVIDVPVSGFQSSISAGVRLRFDGTNCDRAAAPYAPGLAHTWVGDLVVKLISPNNTVVTLISRMGLTEAVDDGTTSGGNNGDDFCGTLLQDGAAASIESAPNTAAPFTGTYHPDNGASLAGNLNTFTGSNANGTWRLAIGDSAIGDTGSIRAFSLIFPSDLVTPTISITPGPSVSVGQNSSASVELTGRASPVASTVTFKLYGPASQTCSGAALFSDAVAYPAGGGSVAGPAHTGSTPGTYHWTATYDGDPNNASVTSSCNAGAVVVTKATPSVAGTPSAGVELGGTISDSAKVLGRVNPVDGATLTFKLFAPDDPMCITPLISPVVDYPAAATDVTTAGFSPTAPGTYRWVATYSGEPNNAAASTSCNDPGQMVVISKAIPTIAATSSVGGDVGVHVTDMATVSGRVTPIDGASVGFRLYGPDDATCSHAPALESLNRPVDSAGNAVSSELTPGTAGTYRWVATYSGDAHNDGVATACDASGQSLVVTTPTPTPTPTATKPATTVLPAACARARSFRVRLAAIKTRSINLAGAKIKAAAIVRADKKVRTLSHTATAATVNLRGLPKGPATLALTVRLASGETRVLKRTYRRCAHRHR